MSTKLRVTARIEPDGGVHEVVGRDAWALLNLMRAGTRADALLEIIASNLDNPEAWDLPQEVHALALSQMLTASLEHLTETDIDCIEAAAMYALTLHYSEWSVPAVEWLTPFRDTWFRDWIAKRQAYGRFARLMRIINPELPLWMTGGGQ